MAILALAWACGTAGCTCREEGRTGPVDAGPMATAARSAQIVALDGSVQVKRSGSMEWTAGALHMQLFLEDKIRTGRESFADLEFEAGGTLRVGPESLVVVSDLSLDPGTQARQTVFTLLEGMVEAELRTPDAPASDFRIRTPTAEAAVLHREVVFQ